MLVLIDTNVILDMLENVNHFMNPPMMCYLSVHPKR